MPEDKTNEAEATQADELTDVLVEMVRVQLATLQAGVSFWSGWVTSASKFAIAADQELLKVIQRNDEANDAIGHITDLSREFLRQMTELPNQAVAEFNAQLAQESKPRPQRTRTARAKP